MSRVLNVLLALALIALPPSSGSGASIAAGAPQDVSLKDLLVDPGSYDHKLIRVTGVVSHGFEDFTLTNSTLKTNNKIWLEYGGRVASDTVYCCGARASATRKEVLTIDGIQIPLTKDKQFRQFDRLIRRKLEGAIKATLIGRFFAGKRESGSNGDSWVGYGHFGCCSLLVIQQVVSAEHTTKVSKTSPN